MNRLALRSTRPSRRSSSCLAVGVAGRNRRSARSQPRPRCPGSAALRSNFLPTSWSAPREPTPESSLLGRSRPRTSARGGHRGGACAAARVRLVHARPHVRGPVREVSWLPGQLGRLNSSRTWRLPSELIVRIGTSLVVGGRRHGGAVGHRRELSDPVIRARLAGAALRASALTPIGRRYTREPKSSLEMTCVLGRPIMKMKPMLCDETEDKILGPVLLR